MWSLVSSKEGSRVEVLAMRTELREKILVKKWDFLSQEQKQAMDRDLTERFLQHLFYQETRPSQNLSLFSSWVSNRNCEQVKDGRFWYLKTSPRGAWTLWSMIPQQLVKTSFGLLEPQEIWKVDASQIDLIHVPSLALTKGYQGWGYSGSYWPLSGTFSDHTQYDINMSQDFIPENHIPVQENWWRIFDERYPVTSFFPFCDGLGIFNVGHCRWETRQNRYVAFDLEPCMDQLFASFLSRFGVSFLPFCSYWVENFIVNMLSLYYLSVGK